MPLNPAFKALSNATRRKILDILRQGEMTAGEIADHFDISKPSVSHHLNILKQADLVIDERQGQTIVYSLNTSILDEVLSWILNFTQKDQ